MKVCSVRNDDIKTQAKNRAWGTLRLTVLSISVFDLRRHFSVCKGKLVTYDRIAECSYTFDGNFHDISGDQRANAFGCAGAK